MVPKGFCGSLRQLGGGGDGSRRRAGATGALTEPSPGQRSLSTAGCSRLTLTPSLCGKAFDDSASLHEETEARGSQVPAQE